MEDKAWVIGKIITVEDSTYGKKVRFYLNGVDDEVSCFTKWPEKMTEGAEIFGHIETKGKYRNFKWGKKPQGGGGNGGGFTDFDREMIKIIYNWVMEQKGPAVKYPEPGIDDVSPEDLPF